jgi:hypothetical protein
MLKIGRREKKRKEGGNERWAAKMLGRGELCRGLEKKGKGRERKSDQNPKPLNPKPKSFQTF